MTWPASIAAAVGDARWLAHRYDPTRDAVHFIPLSREEHRAATFLTDEYLPHGLQPQIVSRADAVAAFAQPAAANFIFHSAFCCSTLLARAMDLPGIAMGLKEPPILNDMVGWRRRGGHGPDQAEVLDDILSLLSRPFGAGEAVIVKPSTVANGLAAAILALRSEARAVLLHAPLRTYLSSIARKGLDGRLWVRTLLLGMLDDKLVDFGFTPRDYLGHTDLQVAAIGWLAHQKLFADLQIRYGVSRVRILTSDHLMEDPETTLATIGAFFGLQFLPDSVAKILSGPAFTTHSKNGVAFGATERKREVLDGVRVHAEEIDKVAHWAEHVAANAGIEIAAGASLLQN